jgi:serine/threonine protein kinase
MFRFSTVFGFKRDMHLAYRTGEVIGTGAKGVVRRVTDHAGDEYACKTIPKDGTLIWKEIVAMRAMDQCPLVAQLVDVYEDRSHVHIVSELCRGGTLENDMFAEEDVKAFMTQILQAIDAMHHAGIVHRDIKPGNFVRVLGPEDRDIKAIDFGISEPLPVIDPELKGTLWYMAPEMFSSKVGPEGDVWAAGVTAVELLTGAMPFDDKRNTRCPGVEAVIRSILLDKYVYEGDDSCSDFIAELLTRDPKRRPGPVEMLTHPWLETKI